jgi:hypothetical protein
MATTTPHYGWDVPTSTDYVKDGATAIETLGDDIDASMFTALQGKKSGLVLLNTTNFSGVGSQSINDVFSATYTNYRIVFSGVNTTTQNDLLLRLRVSGADNDSANYYWSKTGFSYTNASDSFGPNALQTAIAIGLVSSSGNSYTSIDVSEPFSAKNTGTIATYQARLGTAATFTSGVVGGQMSVTTSYTGFTILPAGGTMTGSVSVYGYNK